MPVLPDITSGSTTKTADLYSDTADILPALNEGILVAFSRLDALLRTFAGVSVVGSPYVAGCEDVARWLRVKAAGNPLTYVDRITYTDLAAAAGTPTMYQPDFLDAAGNRTLVLYPTPSAAQVISGSYYGYPPALTLEQGPTWHKSQHFLPCFHAASVLLHKDNLPEEALFQQEQFEAGIAKYKRWLGTSLPPHDFTFGADQKGTM